MSIWPKVEHGGFATHSLVTRPKIRVSASCYLPGVRTPMHVHPQHDQCVSVADGTLYIITEKKRKEVVADESIIISAGVTHAFESGTDNCRFLSVFLGEGASLPGKTTLPEKVSRLFDPKVNKHEKIVETLLSPEQVGKVENLTDAERETLSWVINRLLKRIETGRIVSKKTAKFKKTKKIQNITAWKKDDSLFLWAANSRMLLSLTLKRGENMHDYIKLNDIDVYFPTLKHLPQVEVIK